MFFCLPFRGGGKNRQLKLSIFAGGVSTAQVEFISAFLSVCAEIIFMGLVYLAFLWYCKGVDLAGISINDLYSFSSASAGTFYTYMAVTVACGIMMIRPPQVLRDLVR